MQSKGGSLQVTIQKKVIGNLRLGLIRIEDRQISSFTGCWSVARKQIELCKDRVQLETVDSARHVGPETPRLGQVQRVHAQLLVALDTRSNISARSALQA